MITKQKALFFFVGDQSFKDLADAQKFDLKKLVPEDWTKFGPDAAGILAEWLMTNSAAIVDILTTTLRSRARARKTNGATKRRTPRLQPTVTVPRTPQEARA